MLPAVRNVPWWGVISSAVGPLLLVGGWTAAARLQPPSFDPMAETVSALAAVGAPGRWVMTLTFVMVAICDIVTAVALRPARVAGRLTLVAGSVAGVLVAVNPEHGGGSLAHAIWATIGFGGLAFWPAMAWQRGPSVPWGLRPAACGWAAAALATLTAWFGAELVTRAREVGLAERTVGVAQALWLLAVVLSSRPRRSSARAPGRGDLGAHGSTDVPSGAADTPPTPPAGQPRQRYAYRDRHPLPPRLGRRRGPGISRPEGSPQTGRCR